MVLQASGSDASRAPSIVDFPILSKQKVAALAGLIMDFNQPGTPPEKLERVAGEKNPISFSFGDRMPNKHKIMVYF